MRTVTFTNEGEDERLESKWERDLYISLNP